MEPSVTFAVSWLTFDLVNSFLFDSCVLFARILVNRTEFTVDVTREGKLTGRHSPLENAGPAWLCSVMLKREDNVPGSSAKWLHFQCRSFFPNCCRITNLNFYRFFFFFFFFLLRFANGPSKCCETFLSRRRESQQENKKNTIPGAAELRGKNRKNELDERWISQTNYRYAASRRVNIRWFYCHQDTPIVGVLFFRKEPSWIIV